MGARSFTRRASWLRFVLVSSAFVLRPSSAEPPSEISIILNEAKARMNECQISEARAFLDAARARFPFAVEIRVALFRTMKLDDAMSEEEEERELTSILGLLPPTPVETSVDYDGQTIIGPENWTPFRQKVEVLLLLHRYDVCILSALELNRRIASCCRSQVR